MKREEIDIDSLLEDLIEVNPEDTYNYQKIANKYNCSIMHETEKINSLQYNYYYTIEFDKDNIFYVTIESGINNGTRIISESWECSAIPSFRETEVLKDIKLDYDWYERTGKSKLVIAKAEAILKSNKEKLFEHHRKNSYDNYVTGGNSKLKLEPILSDLKLDYIYEIIDVDINLI